MLPPTPAVSLVPDDQFWSFYGAAPTTDEAARFAAAGAAVRRWCGWHIAPVLTQQFTIDGDGGNRIQVPTLRLVNVVAAVNDGVALDVADQLDWSHDGWLELRYAPAYSFTGSAASVRGGSFTRRPRGVLVTVEHGFESVPDIAQILMELAKRAHPTGIKSTQNGQRSVTYAEPGLMQHERDQVALYRLPSLP